MLNVKLFFGFLAVPINRFGLFCVFNQITKIRCFTCSVFIFFYFKAKSCVSFWGEEVAYTHFKVKWKCIRCVVFVL